MFSQLTCSVQLKTARKSELSYKNKCFSLVCNYLRPSNNSIQLIFYFDSDNLLRLSKMVKCLLSCQPRVTVTSCFVYKVIRDLESIYHLCINSIRRIGSILK